MEQRILLLIHGHIKFSDQDILIDEADLYPECPFKDGLDAFSGAYGDLLDIVRALRDTDDDDTLYSTGELLPIRPVSLLEVIGRL